MLAIEVENLKKYYGKTHAVDGVSFSVSEGEVFGFLGPNGAGKTTTIRCMMDFVRPQEGSISILGRDAQRDSVALKNEVGYLSGGVRLYDRWTGQAHIDFIRRLKRGPDNAPELIERLDFDPTMRTGHLSSNNKQKLGIILTLMLKPRLLILDEPTLGLDPLLQNEIYELLGEMTRDGATVFMSSHNLAEVERVCARVGIIRGGKMVTTESIAALKEKRILTVHAYFAHPVDKAEFLDENTELVSESAQGLVLKAKGDVNTLVKRLGKHTLVDLDIARVTLEDIFMEYYEKRD